MLEDVDLFDSARMLVEELETTKLPETTVDVVRPAPDRSHHRQRGLATEQGHHLQSPLGTVAEPVDAREKNLLDGVRCIEHVAWISLVSDGSRQLFEEERITLGPVENLPGDRIRYLCCAERRAHDGAAVLLREWLERDLRGIGPVHPGGPIAGPIRRDEHDARAGQTFHEGVHDFLGGSIDPVQIFEHEHDWPQLTAVEGELTDGLERARSDRLRRKPGEPLGSFVYSEELEQIRRPFVRVHLDRVEP